MGIIMNTYKKFVLNLTFILGLSFDICHACDSLDELRNKYEIENNVLTTAAGEKHFRYPYESKLHFDLAYYMKDLRAAETVYKAYKNHIMPVVVNLPEDGTSNAANEAFSRALIEICLLFGHPKYLPEQPFFCALKQQGDYGNLWVDKHQQALKAFVQEANTPLYKLREKKDSDIYTIVIITTTVSGGNYSVALSISEHLSKYKNIKTILIDVEDVAKEHDPVMLATDTYTYDMIYSAIFQKTNDFSVIQERKKMIREIQQYIPNTLLAKLKHKVASLKPDLIISTRAYTSDDFAFATLGVPFKLLHTDYELCPSLCSYYRHVPSDWIQYWLPSGRASMFKPLFENHNRLDSYNENDDYETVLKKMSPFLNVSSDQLKSQFQVIGYPCSHFFRIDDPAEQQRLRHKWGIQEHELPIFIVMGKHSTGALKEIFDNLIEAQTELSLKYIFICGQNSELKNQLQTAIDNVKSSKNKFIIHGLLTPAEMNEVMNISTMGISKAGGATVIEALITNRHLLLMHSYPWEQINGSYLKELGLATQYDSTRQLIKQIEECVKSCQLNSEFVLPKDNWQHNLMLQLPQ